MLERIGRRPLLWGVVVLLMVGGGGLAAWAWLPLPGAEWLRASDRSQGVLEKLEVYGRVPEFSLTERSGRRVTREDLRGKVWIANFVYTECTDTCPLQSANMARLQADFADEPDLRLVSMSVDPEHDTPEVLAEYAARFRADLERWLFLTGPRAAIYRLAIEGFRLGVVDRGEKAERELEERRTWFGPLPAWAHPVPNPERQPIIHSSRFVLVDRQAQIRGYYHGTDRESLERLRESTRILLRDKKEVKVLRDRISRRILPALIGGLVLAAGALGIGMPAPGAEDAFKAMAVQRPANLGPAPDLALPSLEGKTVRLKDFHGKVVLLGFFTTT